MPRPNAQVAEGVTEEARPTVVLSFASSPLNFEKELGKIAALRSSWSLGPPGESTRLPFGIAGATLCGVPDGELFIFPYQVDPWYWPILLACGFRASRDAVRVGDGFLRVTFGWFHLETPLVNVDGAHITRHYRWWTAPGVRLSRVDDGLTFGTNHDAGVCVHFLEKVPSSMRKQGHSALTATVRDLEGLVEALGGANGS